MVDLYITTHDREPAISLGVYISIGAAVSKDLEEDTKERKLALQDVTTGLKD